MLTNICWLPRVALEGPFLDGIKVIQCFSTASNEFIKTVKWHKGNLNAETIHH